MGVRYTSSPSDGRVRTARREGDLPICRKRKVGTCRAGTPELGLFPKTTIWFRGMATYYGPTVYPVPPPPNADLATTWAFVEDELDHIMTKSQGGNLSYPKYMATYAVIYNYCTSSKMHGEGETLGMAGRSEFPLIYAPTTHLSVSRPATLPFDQVD